MESVIKISQSNAAKITKWKVRAGSRISKSTILAIYQDDTTSKQGKLKSNTIGIVKELLVKEGETIQPCQGVITVEGCKHPVVMKDMCAECGADLREKDGLPGDRKSGTSASVAMVHSVPELIVSEEHAKRLGKADEDRLLKSRKLVLLVDLDQTLIHTTNDNVPNNLKDVYHFQLWHGRHLLWYHTRFRPGTESFLKAISQLYELHICTFGTRLYAHTIARFLDPEGKYFSHRILSRDECFNATSKTANLKALFPCGDSMVCIIDDREDVWNFTPSMVAVKPYSFFEGTADINAPPGMDKRRRRNNNNKKDAAIAVSKTSRKVTVVKVPKKGQTSDSAETSNTEDSSQETDREKHEGETRTESKDSDEGQNEVVRSDDDKGKNEVVEDTNEVEGKNEVKSENVQLEEKNEETVETKIIKDKSDVDEDSEVGNVLEKTDDGDVIVEGKLTEKTDDVEMEVEEKKDTADKEDIEAEEKLRKSDKEEMEVDEKVEGKDVKGCEEVSMEVTNGVELIGMEKDCVENDFDMSDDEDDEENSEEEVMEKIQEEGSEEKKEEEKEEGSEKKKEDEESKIEEKLDDSKSLETETKEDIENKTEAECTAEEKLKSESKDEKEEEFKEIIEWEDEDDYLFYLQDILTRVHTAFFQMYDEAKDKKGKEPDLKTIIPYIRKKILKGANIVFSGVFPTNVPMEKTREYTVAKNLGAKVQTVFVTKDLADKENGATTHVIAARPGTQKVNQAARHKGVLIVTPDWLWSCNERWERVEERLFLLKVDLNKINEAGYDSPKPSKTKKTKGGRGGDGNGDNVAAGSVDNRRFSASINPMYAFSTEDIADMDKEVEDLISGDSEGEEGDKDSEAEEKDLRQKVLGHTPPESSSEDSLDGGDSPRGWRRKRKRVRSVNEDSQDIPADQLDAEDPDEAKIKLAIEARESPHRIFKRGSETSSSSDNEDEFNNSVGSVDDEMVEAIEKEFLNY